MKIVLAPASFKGTLSSAEAIALMSQVLSEHCPRAEIVPFVLADGGEGTLAAFLANRPGKVIEENVQGPLGQPLQAPYGFWSDASALVEIAAADGLNQAYPLEAGRASSYGLGQLILSAIHQGAKKITIALGGSASTDGGCGMAAALGCRFYNPAGETFVPTGSTLNFIERIDDSRLKKTIQSVDFCGLCDVTNPLDGPTGAAMVFSPQKGADPAMVEYLDQGLKHLSSLCLRDLKIDVSDLPGAGAAGGAGAGVTAFLHGRLVSGVDEVLRQGDFLKKAHEADYLITGEGSFDRQSLMGKAIGGLLARKEKTTKLIVVAGRVRLSPEEWKKAGVYQAYQTSTGPCDLASLKARAPKELVEAMRKVCIDIEEASQHEILL